jgi:hypothetical protein
MAQANSGDFLSPEGRLAFSNGLFEPKSLDGNKFSYGATLIFEDDAKTGCPDGKTLKEKIAMLMAKIDLVVGMKWGDKGKADRAKGLIKIPLLDGNGPQAHSKQSGELWPGFGPGTVFIRPNAPDDARPRVFWKSTFADATKDEVGSGCYGKMVLNAYTWEHPSNGRGVSFGLRGFQKLREGESLGGRTPLAVDKFFVNLEDDQPKGSANDFLN